MRAIKDRYGFLFWLTWILWFAGSFVFAAIFWTTLLQYFLGKIFGFEFTITWVVCVFGTWFMLVIPFMRKKEQIWKRLNDDQEKAVDAWLLGMGIFIGLLVASSLGWSVVFKEKILLKESAAIHPLWVKAVFGSWLVFLIPFLIMMYRQADNIFKTAVQNQTYTPRHKVMSIPQKSRLLPEGLVNRLKNIEFTIQNGHLIDLTLKDGRKIPNVFVFKGHEIMGIYERESLDFEVSQIEDFKCVDKAKLPAFDESKWLRFEA